MQLRARLSCGQTVRAAIRTYVRTVRVRAQSGVSSSGPTHAPGCTPFGSEYPPMLLVKSNWWVASAQFSLSEPSGGANLGPGRALAQ